MGWWSCYALRGEVRRDGHAGVRWGPWHAGTQQTCALGQSWSRERRPRFQTSLPRYEGTEDLDLGPAEVVLPLRTDPPEYKVQSSVLCRMEVQITGLQTFASP